MTLALQSGGVTGGYSTAFSAYNPTLPDERRAAAVFHAHFLMCAKHQYWVVWRIHPGR